MEKKCSFTTTYIKGKKALESLLFLYKTYGDGRELFDLSEHVVSCPDCLQEYRNFVQGVVVELIRKTRDRKSGFKNLRQIVDKNYLNLGYKRLLGN